MSARAGVRWDAIVTGTPTRGKPEEARTCCYDKEEVARQPKIIRKLRLDWEVFCDQGCIREKAAGDRGRGKKEPWFVVRA